MLFVAEDGTVARGLRTLARDAEGGFLTGAELEASLDRAVAEGAISAAVRDLLLDRRALIERRGAEDGWAPLARGFGLAPGEVSGEVRERMQSARDWMLAEGGEALRARGLAPGEVSGEARERMQSARDRIIAEGGEPGRARGHWRGEISPEARERMQAANERFATEGGGFGFRRGGDGEREWRRGAAWGRRRFLRGVFSLCRIRQIWKEARENAGLS